MKTIHLIVPPERPKDFGVTSKEFAKETGYTQDGARKVLMRQKNLVCVTMRDVGARVSVYVTPDKIENNDWYKAWVKEA